MIKVKVTKIWIILLGLMFLISGNVAAQQIKATARLDSANILIGDQVKLFLEIDYPQTVDISFPQVPDTIGQNIEVLDRSKIDTIDSGEQMKQIRSYLITSFDSGSYRIPPYWFKIDMNGRIDSVPTNGVTLNVYSIPIDTTRGPTDIKMPYAAPLTLKEVTPYILGVILIGAILFFILYSIKRRKKNLPLFTVPQKPKEPAHVIALRHLDRIKEEKLWQKEKVKEYYSEITETLREYIEDRFEIPAMEQTSEETLNSFKSRKHLIRDKSFEKLDQILKIADLVKFAKYKPLPEDNNRTLVDAYFFVDVTKAEEEVKQTAQPEDNNEGEEVAIR